MKVTLAVIDDNENEYCDKVFNLDIEQLDMNEKIFSNIVSKIKEEFHNKEFANLVIQFGTGYIRITNLISYLKNNMLNKEEVIEILSKIKVEIQYIKNKEYVNFNNSFLFCVDEKSNLHKIDKLEDCINDLYILVKNHKVDK